MSTLQGKQSVSIRRRVVIFLGEFTKLWREYDVMSVRPSFCLSFRVEQLDFHWTNCHEIWHLKNFLKSVQKIQFSLKPDKNNGYFTWIAMYIYENISLNSSENEKCFGQICTENQNTHFTCSKVSPKNAVYEIMWKNMVQLYRPQMTI
jgi:hypothetical protein